MWRKSLKKIIFDVDGVILDTPILLLQELYAIAQSLGIAKPALEKIRAAWGKCLSDFLEIVLPEVSLAAFIEERDRLNYFKNRTLRVPGTRKVLARLSQVYSLSLLTNRSRGSLFKLMADADIDLNFFQYVQTASDLSPELHKPNPAVFDPIALVLIEEGISREEILYVGDNVIDFQAAAGAGIQFVGILSRFPTTRRDFVQSGVLPEQILKSIQDLPGFLGLPED